MGGSQQSTQDNTIAWKLAALIIIALVVVFVLQKMGFRFVTAGNVSLGVG